MPKLGKIRAGHRAKREGQIFEQQILALARRDGAIPLRIPDGCRQVRGYGGLKLLRVKTPFDFAVFWRERVIVFDAKSTDTKTFSFSQIKPHQLHSLYECERECVTAGYLVHFRSEKLISFFPASTLMKVQRGSSLTPADGILLGHGENWSILKLFSPLTKAEHTIQVLDQTL